MTTTGSTTLRSGTKLVLGLLAFATALLIIARIYRVPPADDLQATLQQQGIPAARQGIDLSREGRKLLPLEEQKEMDALYAEALQALTAEERQRFRALAQKGAAGNDREVAESAALIQKAVRALPPEKSQRLFALVEKAVQLQWAQQKGQAEEQE
jgi:hypothetical protein